MTPAASSTPESVAAPPGDTAARAVVVLVALLSVAILSAFFDRRLADLALTLSPRVVFIGQRVSDIGLSGYMFALSAVTALAALALRSRAVDPRIEAALTALAERAVYIFATLSAAGIAAQAIKHLVGRARPRYVETFGAYHFDMLSMKNSLASFPSGHSATAFSMAVALGFLLPRLRVPLTLLAAAIAVSRIVVQAHFASDIVAGSALGVAAALLVAHRMADWNFAFTRVDGAVRLKAPGAIRAGFRGGSATS